MRTLEASDLCTMEAGLELATSMRTEISDLDQSKEAIAAANHHDLFQQDSPPTSDSTEATDNYPPSATEEAMKTYVHLLNNVYYGRTTGKSMAGDESMPCDCRYQPKVDNLAAACGSDTSCINRMMFIECTEGDCPSGHFCQNRRFQRRQYAQVDVFKTENKGYGLRALTDLPRNTFVIEYMGEVITHKEFVKRTKKYEEEGLSHYYSMSLTNEEIIDATKKGCLARFINHSCNPNCVTQKWVVGKAVRVGIFTRRHVKAGEELSFDYQFERYGATAQTCYCGDPSCTGIIGGGRASSEDRNVSEEDDTTVAKKPGRKPALHPIKSLRELPIFAKEMLESGGKLPLVHRLLSRLELTLPTADAKLILREFIRLRGITLLKIWLSEWKAEQEIVLKILQLLDSLPIQYRNKVEESKIFDTLGRFVDHENEDIKTLAKSLMDKWSVLQIYFRIPKLINKRTLAHDNELKKDENDTKRSTKKRCIQTNGETIAANQERSVNCTREIFDPDNDNHEHPSSSILSYNIRSAAPIPSSTRRPISNGRSSTPFRGRGGKYTRNPYSKYDHKPYERYRRPYDREMSPELRRCNYKYDYRRDRSSDRCRSYAPTSRSFDERRQSRSRNPHIQQPHLPPNWRSAKADNGRLYYYNTVSGKVQWEVPEDRSSSIEGVSRSTIDEVIEKSRQQFEKRRRTEEQSMIEKSRQQFTKRRRTDERSAGTEDRTVTPREKEEMKQALDEEKMKRTVAPLVVKCLQQQDYNLWKGDKTIFKELARLITRHIVECEKKAGRSEVTRINEDKIAKVINSHGKYFAGKVAGYNAV